MANLLVRGLSPKLIATLKAQAEEHGHSLQKEIKAILEHAARLSLPEAREVADAWQRHFAGRTFSDSAELVRDDRSR